MIEHNIAPVDLAEAMACGRDKVYFWLRGDRVPKLDEAAEIADYFGISIDALCGR